MEDVSETRAAAPQTRGVLEFVKDAPINSLAIALGAGFIWGGGATTRAGLALLAFVGRMALREAGVQLLKGKAYDSPRRNFGSGSRTG